MRKKNKHTGSALKSCRRSCMVKEKTTVVTLRPARKSRTKTRKPKYLSLRLQLSPENTAQHSSSFMPTTTSHQLNLFPLHPGNFVEDDHKDDTHDDNNNVAYFISAVDGVGATTLTGLLGAGTSSSACDEDKINNTDSFSPESLTYAYGAQDNEEVDQLVRTAMRNKGRGPSEEKWVRCCSSTADDVRCKSEMKIQRRRLSLKLDYQEIMDAWSDKGPLYIHSDSPQVVPDLCDDDFFSSPSTNGQCTTGGLCRVPENGNSCIIVEMVQKRGEEWKKREASVLRYKEKRQNRLFSKTIRYEVRKINAEKRPRFKGRFVKSS